LDEKLHDARAIHTSTEMGRATLIHRGVPADRVHVVRRGLERFPPMKPLRVQRHPLRLVSIARLVPKKGLRHQLRIHAALAAAGVAFEARIVGEGPLREELLTMISQLGGSEEHTSELQSRENLVCRLLLEKKKIHHLAPRTVPQL